MNRIMKLVLKVLVSIISGVVAYLLLNVLYENNIFNFQSFFQFYIIIIASVITGIIFYLFLSSYLASVILGIMSQIEEKLAKMKLKDLAFSSAGLLIGLVIANLIGLAFARYGVLGTVIITFLNIVFAYLGFRVTLIKKDELPSLGMGGKQSSKADSPGRPKILDTSVIIDSRISEIIETGFIEGKIIIPTFVLDELRHIADSSDSLKRNRGRRGLDILNEIQKQMKVPVETVEWDSKDTSEVDVKLIKVAKKMNGCVVTNDFNLNKVADFQGVKVLNINELANAVKPLALPGEDITVSVIKDGKETGQGIGYLDDGTMIVVEGGQKYIGETIDVSVTSALQTAAGRMIFTKKKERA